jgi:hypothetical protein
MNEQQLTSVNSGERERSPLRRGVALGGLSPSKKKKLKKIKKREREDVAGCCFVSFPEREQGLGLRLCNFVVSFFILVI